MLVLLALGFPLREQPSGQRIDAALAVVLILRGRRERHAHVVFADAFRRLWHDRSSIAECCSKQREGRDGPQGLACGPRSPSSEVGR